MDDSALSNAEFWLSWIATGKLVAALLVAVGVAMEFGGDWIARPYETIVKAAREKELAELHKQSNEANQKAEAEKIERLKLEAQFAWRRITDAQQTEMIAALSKMPQTALVIWVSGDPEATLLAWQLVDILQRSRWRAGAEGRSYPNSILSNVVLSGSSAQLVMPILTKALLKPSIGPIPPFTGMVVPAGTTGVTEANASVVVLVGSRLRPADEAVLDAIKNQLGKPR